MADVEFPYPYGSDLHWFWGWGYRLRAFLNDDKPPSEYDWMIFRPDRLARNAMMRFSVRYPLVIKQVDDSLDFAEQRFAEFKRDPEAGDNLAGALLSLASRIETAVETIAAAEHEPANRANSANTFKLFPKGPPPQCDLVDLAIRLNSEKDSGKTQNEIAREFTGEAKGDDKKAQSLLSQLRRMKRAGRYCP